MLIEWYKVLFTDMAANVNNYISAANAAVSKNVQIRKALADSKVRYDDISKATVNQAARNRANAAENNARIARSTMDANTRVKGQEIVAETEKDIRGIYKNARMTGRLAGGAALLGVGAMQLNKKEEADPTLGILTDQMSKYNTRISNIKADIERLDNLGASLKSGKTDFEDSDSTSTDTSSSDTGSSASSSGSGNTSTSNGPVSFESIQQMAADAGAKFPKLVAAQWALESDWGKKPSGKNNYFGIKAGPGESSTNKGTWEVINGKRVDTSADFKNFDSPSGSVNELVNRWYKDWGKYKGVNRAGSADEAARLLLAENYATDPNYATKLIDIMNR